MTILPDDLQHMSPETVALLRKHGDLDHLPITRDELRTMEPEEVARLHKDGKLGHLLNPAKAEAAEAEAGTGEPPAGSGRSRRTWWWAAWTHHQPGAATWHEPVRDRRGASHRPTGRPPARRLVAPQACARVRRTTLRVKATSPDSSAGGVVTTERRTMGRPAPKVCPEPGCPNLDCTVHARKPWANARERRPRRMSGWAEQERNRRVMRRHGGSCHVCGEPGADQVDHVVPLARGGADEEHNLRPIHATPCHRYKTASESRGVG
jgi:5-methylcytosine-specific restriction protein A